MHRSTPNAARHGASKRSSDLSQPVDYVRHMVELLGDLGVDADAWLARAGLSQRELDAAGYAMSVPVFRELFADALTYSGEPALGLLLGQRLVVHTHGLLGLAAQHCTSLRQVVQLIEQYVSLRTPLVALRHEVGPQHVRVILEEQVPLGAVHRSVLEAVLLALKNILDFLALPQRPVEQAQFSFSRPDYAALANDIFGCEVRWRRSHTGLVVPLSLFDQPLRSVDAAAFQAASAACASELDVMAERDAMATRVRRLLLDKGTSSFPSLQTTARLFNLTPRTLHRRLVDEGSSYRELLAEVRHSLALHHLRTGALTIDAIAAALGYTDTANFRRAFRRRSGMAPSACRSERR